MVDYEALKSMLLGYEEVELDLFESEYEHIRGLSSYDRLFYLTQVGPSSSQSADLLREVHDIDQELSSRTDFLEEVLGQDASEAYWGFYTTWPGCEEVPEGTYLSAIRTLRKLKNILSVKMKTYSVHFVAGNSSVH